MLVVALAATALAVVHGMVRFGDSLVDSARAQSVADAVALAVAAERADVVPRVIEVLDATVIDVVGDDVVTVRVSVDDRVAMSRAINSWAVTTP